MRLQLNHRQGCLAVVVKKWMMQGTKQSPTGPCSARPSLYIVLVHMELAGSNIDWKESKTCESKLKLDCRGNRPLPQQASMAELCPFQLKLQGSPRQLSEWRRAFCRSDMCLVQCGCQPGDLVSQVTSRVLVYRPEFVNGMPEVMVSGLSWSQTWSSLIFHSMLAS